MSQGFRQSQAVLHTWSGLVVGWVLYLIFIAGTASYWRVELTRWMQPELTLPASTGTALEQAQAFLARTAPDATRWSIELPGSRSNATAVRWQPKDAPEPKRGQPNRGRPRWMPTAPRCRRATRAVVISSTACTSTCTTCR